MLLPTVNYYHKELHLRGCSNPKSASGSSVRNIKSSLFLYFSKKIPAQVIREIAKEPETDAEIGNELHLPEVNNNIATSTTQIDQLDNSPEDPEAIEKHSSKSKEVVQDSKRNQEKCKSKRWKWTPEMVDNFVKCLSNIKFQYEQKGLDFESG